MSGISESSNCTNMTFMEVLTSFYLGTNNIFYTQLMFIPRKNLSYMIVQLMNFPPEVILSTLNENILRLPKFGLVYEI